MSTINLKRFVDINIRTHERVASGTRGVTALITSTTLSSSKHIYSYEEAVTEFHSLNTNIEQYAKVYFENGGVELYVVGGISVSGTGSETSLINAIAALPDEYIVVAYCPATNMTADVVKAAMEIAANARANSVDASGKPSIYGVNEKILLARSTVATDAAKVKNFAIKYSTVTGAEMTIAAYLSQIDVYGIDTIHDYSYTEENIAEETVTDADFGTLMSNNYNVNIYLANAVRSVGGNCKDGEEIVNNFVRIVLHQTLTDRLVQLLSEKVKGQTGISKIYATVAKELDRYKDNGYLSLDKIWADEDLVVRYNNVNYTIIGRGDALINGYVIKVLPLVALTEEDRAAHKAPPVYIVIADMYGIRAITVNGEII